MGPAASTLSATSWQVRPEVQRVSSSRVPTTTSAWAHSSLTCRGAALPVQPRPVSSTRTRFCPPKASVNARPGAAPSTGICPGRLASSQVASSSRADKLQSRAGPMCWRVPSRCPLASTAVMACMVERPAGAMHCTPAPASQPLTSCPAGVLTNGRIQVNPASQFPQHVGSRPPIAAQAHFGGAISGAAGSGGCRRPAAPRRSSGGAGPAGSGPGLPSRPQPPPWLADFH